MPRILWFMLCLAVPWALYIVHELHIQTSHPEGTSLLSFSPLALLGFGPGTPAGSSDTIEPLISKDQGVPASQCELGTWKLTLVSSLGLKCNLKNHVGGNLCPTGKMLVVVNGNSCLTFKVIRVDTCSPKDLKCKKYRCGKWGVLRLETGKGELVDVGSPDKMLTCANSNFKLEDKVFCPDGDLSRCAQFTWTTTSTTWTMPHIKRKEVLDVVSANTTLQEFNANLRFDSCALVDGSPSLLGKGMGKEIDDHDTIIRSGRMPLPEDGADFGRHTDVFFSNDSSVSKAGFSVPFMDNEQRWCGPAPNATCMHFQAFVWWNVWKNMWMSEYKKSLKNNNNTILIAATSLKTSCAANLLMNNKPLPPQEPAEWIRGSWRWPSAGFGAFLTFGYLCKSLRLYGFDVPLVEPQLSEADRDTLPHNLTMELRLIRDLVAGRPLHQGRDGMRPGHAKCGIDAAAWLRKNLAWFSVPGRITFAEAHADVGVDQEAAASGTTEAPPEAAEPTAATEAPAEAEAPAAEEAAAAVEVPAAGEAVEE